MRQWVKIEDEHGDEYSFPIETEGTTIEISTLGALGFMCCVILAAVLVGIPAGALLYWIARLVGVVR